MGFHTLFAKEIVAYFAQTKPKSVAILGDQEVVDEKGEWVSFKEYHSGKEIDYHIFEHPMYGGFKNTECIHHRQDLSTVDPESLDRFDCVVDGGTLEHVSNFCHAFGAFWSRISVGGAFIFSYPINNLVDHGYWLPQPRFFFDFARVNGGVFDRFIVFQHAPSDLLKDGDILLSDYVPGAAETMGQPLFVRPSLTGGLFAIMLKGEHKPVALPTESLV